MKEQMRRPSYSEIYMYKSMFWFAIAVFILCPIVNNIVLQLTYWYITTDVAYSFAVTPIGVIQETLSLASTYAGLAVLAICVTYFGRNARGVITLAFVSHAVTFLTYGIALYLWIGGISVEYLLEALLIVLPDAVVMLIIYITLLLYCKKKSTFMDVDRYAFAASMKKHPYTRCFAITAGVFAAVDIIVEAIGMIVYYVDPKNALKIPSTFDEIFDLILQYVYILLFAAVGFVIMVLVGFMAQRLKESGKKKFKELKAQPAPTLSK